MTNDLRALVASIDVPLRVGPGWLRTDSGAKLAEIGECRMALVDAQDIAQAVNALPGLLDKIDQLQAALDAQAGGWLPIESAPRHGLLLTFHPRFGQRVMRPDPVSAGWFLDDTGDATQAVTHWMPLPAGPVEGGEK